MVKDSRAQPTLGYVGPFRHRAAAEGPEGERHGGGQGDEMWRHLGAASEEPTALAQGWPGPDAGRGRG